MKINKIVYSLWTKPSGGNILKKATNWYSPKAQIYCLTLSVMKAAEFFEEVELVTDTEGYNIIKKLKLPFTNIEICLDVIDEKYYDFWSLGKIYAYQKQTKPFIHLDNDAILWKELPHWVNNASVFVQNVEDNNWFRDAYVNEINHSNKVLKYFPENWDIIKKAYCTGIFGGTDIDFIQMYCDKALKFLYDKRNESGWSSIKNKGSYCIIFEQYILACLTEYYNIPVTCFDTYLDTEKLASYGYTHLWGYKKSDQCEKKLRHSLKKNYPNLSLDTIESSFA